MQMESAEPTLLLAILTGGYCMYYVHVVVIDCDCSHNHVSWGLGFYCLSARPLLLHV